MSKLKDFENNLHFLIEKSRKPLIWLETFDYSYVVDTLQNKLGEYMMVWDTASTCINSLNNDVPGIHVGLGTFISFFSEGKIDLGYFAEDTEFEETDGIEGEDAILYLKERVLVAKVRESMFEEEANNTDDRLVAHLQDFVYKNNKEEKRKKKTILIVSTYHFDVNGLEHICERLEMPLPDKEDIKRELCLDSVLQDNQTNEFVFSESFKMDFNYNTDKLVDALNGMYLYDIKNLLKTIMSEAKYSKISPFDYNYGFLDDRVIEGKKQIVKNSGLLEVIDVKGKDYHKHVADIDNLREHLINEKKLIENSIFLQSNLPRPKGILLVGAPGCGKSESAKAAASILDLPLYRLNIGDLLGHKYGQSENRFNEALRTADASAPCVLWIDEIEKAFAGAGNEQNNDDTLTHIIGRFLTWMQEHETLVYLVATANHLSQMRPELLRKGRWDEIYFLTYPSIKGRAEILKKCLQRFNIKLLDKNDNVLFEEENGISPSKEEMIVLAKLLYRMKGWSGAEISSVVVDVAKDAYRKNKRNGNSNKTISISLDDLTDRILGDTSILKNSLKDCNITLCDEKNVDVFSDKASDFSQNILVELLQKIKDWSNLEINSLILNDVDAPDGRLYIKDFFSVLEANENKTINDKIEKEIREIQLKNLVVFDDQRKEEIRRILKEKYDHEKNDSKQQYSYVRYKHEGYKSASNAVCLYEDIKDIDIALSAIFNTFNN